MVAGGSACYGAEKPFLAPGPIVILPRIRIEAAVPRSVMMQGASPAGVFKQTPGQTLMQFNRYRGGRASGAGRLGWSGDLRGHWRPISYTG